MKQNNYFTRLKQHPGLGTAFIMSLLIFGAAFTNKNIENLTDAAIFGVICATIPWIGVLISNFKSK